MVQLKYFGDNRDFFKYDLITSILQQSEKLSNYVFIPMLTEHRDDNEGNLAPRKRGKSSNELLDFILRCREKSLKHWEEWLRDKVDAYITIEPVNQTFFSDQTREKYWKEAQQIICKEKALIFADPDTGLQTGRPSYLMKMGREKYILNLELKFMIAEMLSTSVLMIYQHLTRNRHHHIESVNKKLQQIRSLNGGVSVCAYREDDLAFLFVSKSTELHTEILSILNSFYSGSTSKFKSVHP